MGRKAAFVALPVLAMSCVGCSWMARLVVTNRSDAPIVVEYSTPPVKGRCELEGEVPSVAASPDVASNGWVGLPDGDFAFRRDQCSVILTLPPRTSLLFATELNYGGHGSGKPATESLARYRLRIQAPDGELVVSGSELVRRFEEKSGHLFEMVYDRPSWARKQGHRRFTNAATAVGLVREDDIPARHDDVP